MKRENIYAFRGNEYIPHDFCAVIEYEDNRGNVHIAYPRTEREVAMLNDVLVDFTNPTIIRRHDMSQDEVASLLESPHKRDISKDWATHMSYYELGR